LDVSREEANDIFMEICSVDEKELTFENFKKWYLTSEKRILKDMRDLFDALDADGSGLLSLEEIAKLVDVNEELILEELGKYFEDGKLGLTREEFEKWYVETDFFTNEQNIGETIANVEYEEAGFSDMPEDTCSKIMWIITLPLIGLLALTLPDVRDPGKKQWCL